MTHTEATLPASELPLSESLTPDTYNELLYAARSLHYRAQEQEVYGDLRVTAHTPDHTIMTAGHPKLENLQFMIEDIPAHGVLLRAIRTYPDPANDQVIQEDAVLLNSLKEQPRMFRDRYPGFGIKDSAQLVAHMLTTGTPLDEGRAQHWVSELHGLELARKQPATTRPNKTALFLSKLLHQHA